MDEPPLSFANILAACAVNGFYAGIIGNFAASIAQWGAIKSAKGLWDVLLKGTGSALKNHDLVRSLVRAQLDAATQVIDITLLEDYGAEPTAAKNWFTHLTYLFPTKALRDQSNEQIKCLWDLRAKLEHHLKGLNELTATDLDRNLVVEITNAQAIAAPDLSSGPEGPYAEWSDAAAHAMCEVLTNLATPLRIPEELRTRIQSGEWTDMFRVAFREELKRDKKAETAYFINVHDTLVHYAHQNGLELGDLKTALQQGFDRQDGKLLELRNLLFSLRDHVRNLEVASDSERRQITKALEAQQANWRKLFDEQQKHWRKAHAAHQSILNQQKKTNNRLGAIENRIREVGEILEDVRPPKSTAQQLYLEACALVDASRFEQAAIKAEEACAAAGKEREEKLLWKTSLLAARSWLNHLNTSRISATTREGLESRMAQNIADAAQSGAPARAIAMVSAMIASHRRDHDETVKHCDAVIADPCCDEYDRAEAVGMKLQALLLSKRLDEALAYNEEFEKSRETKDGERRLFIIANWLRILCESQMATDDDVSYFVAAIERNVDVPPKRRLYMVNLVVPHFSVAAQEPPKPTESALVVERLKKLNRLSTDFVSQFDRILEATVAQQVEVDTGEGIDEFKASLASLLESARPEIGDRHSQTLRLLEVSYALAKPTGDAVTMMNLASQIAEMSALRGDTDKTEIFLGYCDSWVEASKDSHPESGRTPWYSLRAKALMAKGRTLYRLGWRLIRDGLPAERSLLGAQAALEDAHAFGATHRAQLDGDTELFLADASFWLGETSVQLGLNENAAQHFRNTRSPAAMAHTGFSKHVGMVAWLKEAESHCFAGDTQRAIEVVSELIASSSVPDEIAEQAQRFKVHLDENVVPVVKWFSGSNAARIKEMAKRHGLRAAISAQTRYLVDWHERFYTGEGSWMNQGLAAPSMREAYDFWGRGGFSRVVAAIRAKPNSAVAVDALSCEDIRHFARLLCPLFETVIIKWKGPIESDLGIRGFPDPAPDRDEFGDFFGGMGLVRAGARNNTTVLIGSANLLPADVGVFLSTEALPLIRSGRLVLFPAPLVGCTQTAIGWTDDVLTRYFLKGVISVAASESRATRSAQQSIDVAQVAIPYIDGVSLPDLAHVLEDASDSLLPLRSLVFDSLSSNLAHERWAKINSVEGDFRDACRRLEEVLAALKPKSGGSDWSVKTIASAANAVVPGTARIGSDANTDDLRAVCPIDKDLAPWIPFWRLQGMGGYLDWSCDLDNPSAPPTQTPFGLIRHSWIYPGSGGPGLMAGWECYLKTDP